MAEMRWKRLLVIAAIPVAIVLIATVEVELPPNLRGSLVAQGNISSCEFQKVRSGNFSLDLKLDTPMTPKLRFIGPSSERGTYEALCTRKPKVRITYHAIKSFFVPVGFWIDRVAEV